MRLGLFQKAPVANFVIAGASRSGTTSLYHYLGSHPDIFLPDTKEQWYFNCDDVYRKGLSAYRRKFSGWNGQAMIGDITPSYFV
ncbi:MAG: sulfotransferase, partial [Gammaproteobacteria bacterium]|nr:sulfotransferase [Gammaproteobacteria bacterium]